MRAALLASAFVLNAAPPALASPFAGADPRFDRATLDRLLAEINAPDRARRQAAATRLVTNVRSPDAPLLHARLHRRTDVGPVDYANLLRSIGAHVPDRRGRFGPAPQDPVDWLEKLLATDQQGALVRALHESRVSVVLMRALSATARSEAAVSLLRFAYRHQGAFRDECGRLIRAMGDHAVPALVRSSALRDPLAFKMMRYAAYQLDRMNRARPELALRAADPRLLVDLLHAYGEVRAPGAVNAVLAQTDAAAPAVRRAARWALLRYVSGRPPTAVRRHLRLPGGRTSDVERSLYLTYRQLAHQSLARQLAEHLAPKPDEVELLRRRFLKEDDPRTLAARLFAEQDAGRFEAQQARLREAQRLASAGALDRATADLDRLLLTDPDQPPSEPIAAVFQQHALQLLATGHHQQAAIQLTKSLALMPSAGRSRPELARRLAKIRAQRAVAEAMREQAAGRRPDWWLGEASSLAPDLPLVREATERVFRARRRRMVVVASAGGLTLLGILAGAGARRWRRRGRGRARSVEPSTGQRS